MALQYIRKSWVGGLEREKDAEKGKLGKKESVRAWCSCCQNSVKVWPSSPFSLPNYIVLLPSEEYERYRFHLYDPLLAKN